MEFLGSKCQRGITSFCKFLCKKKWRGLVNYDKSAFTENNTIYFSKQKCLRRKKNKWRLSECVRVQLSCFNNITRTSKFTSTEQPMRIPDLCLLCFTTTGNNNIAMMSWGSFFFPFDLPTVSSSTDLLFLFIQAQFFILKGDSWWGSKKKTWATTRCSFEVKELYSSCTRRKERRRKGRGESVSSTEKIRLMLPGKMFSLFYSFIHSVFSASRVSSM